MTFQPRHQMHVDEEGGSLYIRCPIWANDLVRDLPSRRWNKKRTAWQVHIIRQNIEPLKKLIKMGGVEVSESARTALEQYDQQIASMGKRGVGFPAWYKFKTTPLPHQAPGLAKGYGLTGYGVFMPLQTGKSKLTIDLLAAHRMEAHIDSVLILVKRTLRRNWLDQLETHCPIPYSTHLPETGDIGWRRFMHWMTQPHDFKIMLVGWESLSAGGMIEICEKFMDTMMKPAIVGDELTYIAGHKAERSHRAVALAKKAVYRYGLAGKPWLEGPLNMFMEFEFIDPNIIGIGDWYAFRNRYCVMGGYERETPNGKKIPTKVVGYQNMDELTALISPHLYQVDKGVLKLPPKRFEVRTVELTKQQQEMYRQIKRDGVMAVKDQPDRVLQNVLEVYLRLHQVAGGYGVSAWEKKWTGVDGKPKIKTMYDPVELIAPEENPKMIEVMDVMNQIKDEKQALIWAVYMPEIEAIVKLLRMHGFKIGELHGKIPDEERQPIVREFQRGGYDVIVGNAGTGGMGFTLTAAEVSIFYNNTFKAIDRVQAEDRPDAIGQTKSGIWIDILAEKTVDLVIKKAVDAKMDLSDYLHQRVDEVIKLMDGDV